MILYATQTLLLFRNIGISNIAHSTFKIKVEMLRKRVQMMCCQKINIFMNECTVYSTNLISTTKRLTTYNTSCIWMEILNVSDNPLGRNQKIQKFFHQHYMGFSDHRTLKLPKKLNLPSSLPNAVPTFISTL